MNLIHEINKIINNLNNKEFKTVINSCEKLIKSKIENTIIYNLYGLGYQNLGLYEESIPKFEKSIKLQSNNYLALNNLAISLKAIEKFRLSEKTYQNCLKIKPDYALGIINYANLKEHLNEFEDSIKLYLSALDLKSGVDQSYVFLKLSKLYLSLGNISRARQYLIKILEKNPENTPAYELFSELADYQKDKKYLLNMENLIENKKLTEDEIINLSFPLGKAHDSLKNFDKAFYYFSKGNDLKKNKIKYDLSDFLKLNESIKQFFEGIEVEKVKKKKSEKKIIFICGMPRSGTTLIEQIISSHKNVLATGENNYLSTFIKKNYLKEFSLNKQKVNQDIFSKDNLFNDYVFNLFQEYNFNSKVFTDKSVQNFLWIGFIKIFFPNSKIIITDRNSKDICLSIFKINFKNGFMNFAYNQKDIAYFYNAYLDLVDYWKKKFHDDIYTIKYENLIDDSESEIRKLIDFCGLSWDSNCLRHDKNKSAIKTASLNQARKPIYKSSKNQNQNYSLFLQEMFDLLKN